MRWGLWVVAGVALGCGLRADGTIGCWGRNTYNQAPANRSASLQPRRSDTP
jgi:hypothetical protein